jgi:hypothetical protein
MVYKTFLDAIIPTVLSRGGPLFFVLGSFNLVLHVRSLFRAQQRLGRQPLLDFLKTCTFAQLKALELPATSVELVELMVGSHSHVPLKVVGPGQHTIPTEMLRRMHRQAFALIDRHTPGTPASAELRSLAEAMHSAVHRFGDPRDD